MITIKARDLRIGNFGIDRESRICIVEELSINEEPRILAISGGLTSLPVTPIPLTEEWLLKFGFEKKSHSFVIYPVSIKKQGVAYFYVPTSIHLKYVHQLQNLFHSLTNEELIYKP